MLSTTWLASWQVRVRLASPRLVEEALAGSHHPGVYRLQGDADGLQRETLALGQCH
jgi:hypothetical protein